MNSFDQQYGWERYAKSVAEAWEKEQARQSIAYQQLESEMNRLMELLMESQQNQNEFMKEAARQIEYYAKGFDDLKGEVSHFIQEARQLRVNNDVSEQVGFMRLNARIEDILAKLDNLAASFPATQPSPLFAARESDHLMQSSVSNPISKSSSTFVVRESDH